MAVPQAPSQEAYTAVLEEKDPPTAPEPSDIKRHCSCVVYAREQGVAIPYNTDAGDLMPNSPPGAGGLVLLRYPNADHVAVITGFTEHGILVREGNYKHCQETFREIRFDDQAIRGFWIPTPNQGALLP